MKRLSIFTSIFFLFFVLTSLLSETTKAKEIIVNSSDVNPQGLQKIVDSASVGDTIYLPPGDYAFDWPAETTAVVIPEGINIIGAGSDKDIAFRHDPSQYTILRQTIPRNGTFFRVNCHGGDGTANPSSKPITRISGISFIGFVNTSAMPIFCGPNPEDPWYPTWENNVAQWWKDMRDSGELAKVCSPYGACNISGYNDSYSCVKAGGQWKDFRADDTLHITGIWVDTCKDFRIDHCSFTDMPDTGVFSGHSGSSSLVHRGVVDHCYFENPYRTKCWERYAFCTWGYGINAQGYNAPFMPEEDHWALENMSFGRFDTDVIYIEDSIFNVTRHAIASNTKAWYVVRHSLFVDSTHSENQLGVIDVHGWTPYGGRGMESYYNTIIGALYPPEMGVRYAQGGHNMRGGGGAVFNNTIVNCSRGVGISREGSQRVSSLYIWNNTMNMGTEVSVGSTFPGEEPYVEGVDYFLRPPNVGEITGDFGDYRTLIEATGYPYPYPHPLTLENVTYLKITERLTDKYNNPVMANISIGSIRNSTDSEGRYFLTIPLGIYDILFNIANFFIENFWIKLLSVNISSSSYNKLTHITNFTEQKNISLIFNITGNQTILAYSPEKPRRVLKNSTFLTEYSSISDLIASYGWFYNETEKILYVRFNEKTIG